MAINRRSLLKLTGYFGAATAVSLSWPQLRKLEAAEMLSITMQLDWKFNVQFAELLLTNHR